MAASTENKDQPHKKFVIVGEPGVGKTTLLIKFSENREPAGEMTSVDVKYKTIEVNKKQVKLDLWDTGGQEKFRTLTDTFFRYSAGVICMYDVTNRESFEYVKHWVNEANRLAPKASVMVVGSKIDREAERQVQTREGEEEAARLGCTFAESTVKHTPEETEEIFRKLVINIFEHTEKEEAASQPKSSGSTSLKKQTAAKPKTSRC